MSTIGSLPVTTFRTAPDQNDYSLAGDNISSTHKVALRRQLPVQKGTDAGVLRANARVAKTFPVGETTKEVVFNISGIIPVGVNVADVLTWKTDVVDKIATSTEVGKLMTAGDISLTD